MLPWPYVAILVAEVAVLGGLAAASRARPPLTYEAGWLGTGSMPVMSSTRSGAGCARCAISARCAPGSTPTCSSACRAS